MNDLKRFLDAQENDFERALAEIKRGRKQSHWMWYIFPQIAGLGSSETSRFYAVKDRTEAELYLAHPVLGARLVRISEALLEIEGKTANQIFGSLDDVKLKSSMTLFGALKITNPIFQSVLDEYFNGTNDLRTLQLIDD
ncbi:MAG: DUF1810 domain-containing protein [Acidobacteria bacterium]|jgi:uncharacterized protein (DUF1810 family)|nr:DUF1810 domain-containing protein [Acidobacteriota bacterium]